MKLYTITMSEDGLLLKGATNVKALQRLISLTEYKVTKIVLYDPTKPLMERITYKKYNYKNLVECLKVSTEGGTMFAYVSLESDNQDNGQLHIREIEIVSK